MKLKISFDKKTIGNFFLEHAEKVVFGFFVLVFASIIYGAMMNREKFDKAPKQLSDQCDSAKRVLEGERQVPFNAPDYKKIADKIAEVSKQGIDVKSYECDLAWDKPLFGLKGKRDQPELFDVQELRAAADFGAFQILASPAAEGPAGRNPRPGARGIPQGGAGATATQGKRWVVLTGLVPIEQQASAYKNAYRDAIAYDPVRDVPTYAGYYVERAEINSPADIKKPTWIQFFSVDVEKDTTKDWSQTQPEVVDAKYVNPILTFPLGPLQNRNWGKNIAHEPEISVFSARNAMTFGEDAQTAATEEGNAAGNLPTRRGAPQPTRMTTPVRGGFRTTQGQQGGGVISDSETKYKLLRFFDFSIKPGKSYIYRVRLVLKNPNQGVDASKLIDAKFAKEELLPTEWSKQTDVIYMPNDTQVLVDSVKTRAGDLSGKVYLLKWMEKTGQEVYKDFPIERGQVLNFNNEIPVPVSGDSNQGRSIDSPSVDKTNFTTDATVLDMDGGKKLIGKDRNLTEPDELLLMFVQGKSSIIMSRSELDDMSKIQEMTTKPETTTAPNRFIRTPPPGRGRTDAENRLFDDSENPTRRQPTRTRP